MLRKTDFTWGFYTQPNYDAGRINIFYISKSSKIPYMYPFLRNQWRYISKTESSRERKKEKTLRSKKREYKPKTGEWE